MQPLARVLGIPADALAAAGDLARVLRARGQRDRARRIHEGCLALDPSDLGAALALAEMALEDGDPRQALSRARHALESAPGSIDAALLVARALLLGGAIEDARGWLAHLGSRDPRARALLSGLAPDRR